MIMMLRHGNSDDGNGDADEVDDSKGGRRLKGKNNRLWHDEKICNDTLSKNGGGCYTSLHWRGKASNLNDCCLLTIFLVNAFH